MQTFAPRGKIHGPILPQFILETSLSFGAKVMYALLCNYASESDHCWPSQATLAARLSCSVSSVKKYLAELVRINLVQVRREQYRSSVYYMLHPASLKTANHHRRHAGKAGQSLYMEQIIHRMENLPKDPRIDNPLKITNDARKAGLDSRR